MVINYYNSRSYPNGVGPAQMFQSSLRDIPYYQGLSSMFKGPTVALDIGRGHTWSVNQVSLVIGGNSIETEDVPLLLEDGIEEIGD